jgi:cation diffusion facilitator family transporter
MASEQSRIEAGPRLAFISVAASATLAFANVTAGLLFHSTSVVAAGLEFAGDVLASLIVFFGMLMASRPPDEDHPYGHGRFEILAGLVVGLILIAGGAGICVHSLSRIDAVREAPRLPAAFALIGSMVIKSFLSFSKFRVGRRIGSAALVADAWNDSVDILSAAVALTALLLALHNPAQFLVADGYGGFGVGIIVIVTGLRVVRDTSLELTDTMPSAAILGSIRRLALEIPQVEAVEKCYARKTGLQYHVDLHIEVDPELTVASSHYIAHKVQERIIANMPEVANVLVHIEPTPAGRIPAEEAD